MRYHNVSFMSQSCLHFLFIQSLYSFFKFAEIFYLLVLYKFAIVHSIITVHVFVIFNVHVIEPKYGLRHYIL